MRKARTFNRFSGDLKSNGDLRRLVSPELFSGEFVYIWCVENVCLWFTRIEEGVGHALTERVIWASVKDKTCSILFSKCACSIVDAIIHKWAGPLDLFEWAGSVLCIGNKNS